MRCQSSVALTARFDTLNFSDTLFDSRSGHVCVILQVVDRDISLQRTYRGADKFLARPTSRFILSDG